MTQGLVLFAHGARDPAWAAPFEAIATLVRAHRPTLLVRLAFLELMRPSLAEAAAELAQAGCHRVDIRPMFLGTGSHVRRDLPLLMEELRSAHGGVAFTLHEAIGEHRGVHAAMAEAIAAALDGPGGGPP
jgi:sirohydrochlorin cobaltochelatase